MHCIEKNRKLVVHITFGLVYYNLVCACVVVCTFSFSVLCLVLVRGMQRLGTPEHGSNKENGSSRRKKDRGHGGK